jgi:hypothetical protein
VTDLNEIRANLRAGQTPASRGGGLRFLVLAAGAVMLGFGAMWWLLRPHPLPRSPVLPTWEDIQASVNIGMPAPSYRLDPAIQSRPPASTAYAGKSPSEVGRLADEVCFQRAHQRYPHWSKTPRLTTKELSDFHVDDMDHVNELMRCLLTEGLPRYCSGVERRTITVEIAMYFRIIDRGNKDLDRMRERLQSGKVDPLFAEMKEALDEPLIDPGVLQQAASLQFVHDLSVLAAIEARLRDGLLTKVERDYFTPVAPEWIRARFAEIEPPKSTCPDEPWWAFWR